MKEFLEQLAKAIPEYLEDLLMLVSGPKRFVADRILKHHQPLKKSLIFLTVSYLIVAVLSLPLNRGELWLHLGATAIFTLLYATAYAGVMDAAWRLVGGSAAFRKVIPIYFYYAGVLELLMGLTFLAVMGGMKAADPTLFDALFAALSTGGGLKHVREHLDRVITSPALQVAALIEFVGICGMFAWFIAGWGAYRQLNGVSKLRSLAAAVLFIVYSIPVTAVTFIIALVLAGASASVEKEQHGGQEETGSIRVVGPSLACALPALIEWREAARPGANRGRISSTGDQQAGSRPLGGNCRHATTSRRPSAGGVKVLSDEAAGLID